MKLVIFGLTISSSWGNGHATLWRGLCRALIRRGHEIVFFEKDVPYYAAHRDLLELSGLRLELYSDWRDAAALANRELRDADVGMVTSYCPDAVPASRLVLDSDLEARAYYDLDTPVTLDNFYRGERVDYIPPEGLRGFDLVLSYTGGRALEELRSCFGARRVAPLYGSVDPGVHRPAAPERRFACDLSYLGTYAQDRQALLEKLFLQPAVRLPGRSFQLAGAMYPPDFPWQRNIFHIQHLAPSEHASFYCSSRLTLNITREAMTKFGHCPSGRLFEAAACGVPILSDYWEGLDGFFSPGSEILIAGTVDPTNDAIHAIKRGDHELHRIGQAARDRALSEHTAEKRAEELELLLEKVREESRTVEGGERISVVSGPSERPAAWGIIPAAGAGSRIQPLAFSKELLPVGSRVERGSERPRAVSEFLAERMIQGGARKLCFVISPGKTDIMEYFGGRLGEADICYAVQPKPAGLCDAIFRAAPLVHPGELVNVGLPDTIWFPENGFQALPDDALSFLLFPVEHPEFFDAVLTDEEGNVTEIEVKKNHPRSHWVWGAFKMPGEVFHSLHRLWFDRGRSDEYMGTLVNEYIRLGGAVRGVYAGESYVDVGTLNGYREAIQVLSQRD